ERLEKRGSKQLAGRDRRNPRRVRDDRLAGEPPICAPGRDRLPLGEERLARRQGDLRLDAPDRGGGARAPRLAAATLERGEEGLDEPADALLGVPDRQERDERVPICEL